MAQFGQCGELQAAGLLQRDLGARLGELAEEVAERAVARGDQRTAVGLRELVHELGLLQPGVEEYRHQAELRGAQPVPQELGPVRQPDGDLVPAPQADLREAPGRPVDLPADVGEGVAPVVEHQRRPVAVARDELLERLPVGQANEGIGPFPHA